VLKVTLQALFQSAQHIYESRIRIRTSDYWIRKAQKHAERQFKHDMAISISGKYLPTQTAVVRQQVRTINLHKENILNGGCPYDFHVNRNFPVSKKAKRGWTQV
jgi:hypothetical protein